MWMSRLLWCLCSVLPVFLSAQVDTAWVRRYDGPNSSLDQANALAIDNAGNVYVTGNSYGVETSSDFTTIKYYLNGDTAWVRRYNGPGGYDFPYDVAVDDAGNVYVTGSSGVFGGNDDYTTIKYYPNGDTAWIRQYSRLSYSDEVPCALAVDDSGCVYITGCMGIEGYPYLFYLTVKYYPNGDTVWTRLFPEGGNPDHYANDLAVDDAGNAYITGSGSGDFVTVKYYPNGDTAWVRTYNGAGNSGDEANAIALDTSGNVYVTGYAYLTGGGEDYATIKYYPNGDIAWVSTYNGPADETDEALAITVDGAGNVYVTGYSSGSGTYSDWATMKYYPNGDTAWARRLNGTANGEDEAYAIAVDGLGNVYVTGHIIDSVTGDDYTTVKYDASGNLIWLMMYDGCGSDDDACDIAVHSSGNFLSITGSSYGSGTGMDFATIKYVQPVIILSQAVLGFGGVNVGQSADLPLVIYNGGQANLLISDISNNLGVYTHDWDPSDSLILPGDSLEVVVTFTPNDTIMFTDTLWINNNSAQRYVVLMGQGLPTGVAEGLVTCPREFVLRQPLPNPCKSFTLIKFELPEVSGVDLAVYDVSGRVVSQLINGMHAAGIHEILFDASNMSSGVYFCLLKAAGYTAIEKVIIAK
jgi:hypothetical protein